MEVVLDLVAGWPQLEELKRAVGQQGRWDQALSLTITSARSEIVAVHHAAWRCIASSGCRVKEDVECAVLISSSPGSIRHAALRT